jgi:hypothetical protein
MTSTWKEGDSVELFKLFGRVLIDNDEANKSLQSTESMGQKVGRSLKSGIATAAKFGAALVAGAGVAIGAMVNLVNKVGQNADRLLDLEAATGMTVESIQEWEHATRIAGTSLDAVTKASEQFTKRLDTMRSETSKGNRAIQQLGHSFDDISAMDADTRMDTLIEALAGVEDKTERARLGTDLFGGAWKDVAPIVDLGVDALKDAKANANVFSREDLERANDMRIKFDMMKERASFFALEMGMVLLPYMERFFEWIEENMPAIERFIQVAFDTAVKVIGWTADKVNNYLLPALRAIMDWVGPKLPLIQSIFEGVFGAIETSIKTVTGVIKTAIEWFDKLLGAIRDYRKESADLDEAGGGGRRNLDHGLDGSYRATVPATPAAAFAGGGNVVHEHSGVIRHEGVNDTGQLVGYVDVFLDEMRRELRSGGGGR